MLPRIYPYEDSLWIEDHDEVKSLNDLDQNEYPVKLVDEKVDLKGTCQLPMILYQIHGLVLLTLTGREQ